MTPTYELSAGTITFKRTIPFVQFNSPSIKCLRCGSVSHNLNDIEQRYCAKCHRWHEESRIGVMCNRVQLRYPNSEKDRRDIAFIANEAGLAGFELVDILFGVDTAGAEVLLGALVRHNKTGVIPSQSEVEEVPEYATLIYRRVRP